MFGGPIRQLSDNPTSQAEPAALCYSQPTSGYNHSRLRSFQSRGGKILDRGRVRIIVRQAAERAGVAADVSPHWLRHAHASHALDRGAPIHLVQSTLGHASVSTTSCYLHAKPGDSSARFLQVSIRAMPQARKAQQNEAMPCKKFFRSVRADRLLTPCLPERDGRRAMRLKMGLVANQVCSLEGGDVLYAEELIGPETVNTLPLATLEAFHDHGRVRGATVLEGWAEAEQELAKLAGLAIDLEAITERLQVDGVELFAESYNKVMAALERKREATIPATRTSGGGSH